MEIRVITIEQIENHKNECITQLNKVGEGPWTNEPHRKNWKHKGLDCMIIRASHSGALCGYVGVNKNHGLYRKSYTDEKFPSVEVHGGITYSDNCGGTICHIKEDNTEDDTWWFGFDCAHGFDLIPVYDSTLKSMMIAGTDKEYRDFKYVTKEVEALAEQLSNVG